MKAFISTCILGVLAFDEKKNLVAYKLFEKNPELIAKKLASESTPEEKEIAENLKNLEYTELVSDRKIEIQGIKFTLQKDNLAAQLTREKLREFSKDLDFADNLELNRLLSQVNANLTKEKIKKQKKDKILIQAIGVVGEIDKTLNVFSERLIEWYGLHFPELQRVLNSNEKYSEFISNFGEKTNTDDERLRKLAEKSSGMEFSKKDIETVKLFSDEINNLFKLRDQSSKYVENLAESIIPNTAAVAGPLLAARLIQLSGGLEKLSRMPSSTIQLIGAEKALFRHLKGEGKSPKFGAIYFHPLIQQSPNEKRGKVARLIAAKLSLASRLDAYSEKKEGEKLRKELEDDIRKI